MTDKITKAEVSKAIAAILTRHPQMEKLFAGFEPLDWTPIPRGLIKRFKDGGAMIAERSWDGKVTISFTVYMTKDD